MKRRSNYSIGYCRPPVSTRFKPGQSGNPNGRPKGRKNLVALLKDALDKRIPIREGDTIRKVATAEAIILALMSKALKGDSKACAMLIGLTSRVKTSKAMVRQLQELNALSFIPTDERRNFDAYHGPPRRLLRVGVRPRGLSWNRNPSRRARRAD
jgi:Family of unknown function (DUF5681)